MGVDHSNGMIKTVNVDVIFSEKCKWWDKKLSTTQAFRSVAFDGWVIWDEPEKEMQEWPKIEQ